MNAEELDPNSTEHDDSEGKINSFNSHFKIS